METSLKPGFYLYLYEEYLKYFDDWNDQIREIARKNQENTLIFSDFKAVYDLSSRTLNEFYRDFKRTRSFLAIKEKLEENDHINARLYDYNILNKTE